MYFNKYKNQVIKYFHLEKKSESEISMIELRRAYKNTYLLPGGGSRIFSRGGGRIFFENFVDLFFFRSTELIFWALPKHGLVPVWGQIFCAAGKILKKQSKQGVFRHFLESFDQKIAFFRSALPLKISIY